ncbi:MAG: hypothetical protein ACRBB4_03890 [Neptuniibacter sp.]
MGTSFSNWDDVAAYFVFANQPIVLMILAAFVAVICISLIISIKKHEDQAFEDYVKKGAKKQQ